ncbi:predicted protein [Lichtheimia corymbifera JMRC:FSU:9682]|uniref:Uncharacterized protein n=1 Tax=Lichtheimia corymbifera JMRC:FSU:9682 TaxID=1263082 RepID=A0A068RYP9_9FUNG|nr:predicted protein [Lichtheimia corymbifera JMRC:FSU:9682]
MTVSQVAASSLRQWSKALLMAAAVKRLVVAEECAGERAVSRNTGVVVRSGVHTPWNLPFSQRQSDQGSCMIDMMG